MDPLKMYFLLKMVIFHCYVSLLEGSFAKLKGKFQGTKFCPGNEFSVILLTLQETNISHPGKRKSSSNVSWERIC